MVAGILYLYLEYGLYYIYTSEYWTGHLYVCVVYAGAYCVVKRALCINCLVPYQNLIHWK